MLTRFALFVFVFLSSTASESPAQMGRCCDEAGGCTVTTRTGCVAATATPCANGGTWTAGATCSTTPACPSAALRVNADYSVNPAGSYYVVDNWVDTNGNGLMSHVSDKFSFHLPGSQFPVNLADASIIYIESVYGNWWYISGSAVRHAIYRTRDFRNFELHMYAFDPGTSAGAPSGQWLEMVPTSDPNVNIERIHIGSKVYQGLYGGGFFYCPWPGASDDIHLISAGVEDPANPVHNGANYQSSFHFIISKADFLSWHSSAQPSTDDGIRFSDARRPATLITPLLGYKVNNTGAQVYYDGGYQQGQSVPCTFDTSMYGTAAGQVTRSTRPDGTPVSLYTGQRFVSAGGANGAFADSAIEHGVNLFFDPLRAPFEPYAASAVYSWCWVENGPRILNNGCHEGLGSILSSSFYSGQILSFDAVAGSKHLAFGRNSNNPISVVRCGGVPTNPSDWVLVDNGTVNAGPVAHNVPTYKSETCNGAWAEGSSVLYNFETQCYYYFYTRNADWAGTAYQIVYRKLPRSAGRFSDMVLENVGVGPSPNRWDNPGVPEKVLLASTRITTNDPTLGYPDGHGRSYGIAGTFALQTTSECGCASPDPRKQYYVMFHAKRDDGAFRVLFFKELSFVTDPSDPNYGDIKQLSDATPYPINADPHLDIHRFIVPVCRKGAPWRSFGDTNGDGVVGCSDAIAAASAWGQQSGGGEYRADLDWNLDGLLEATDKANFDAALDFASCAQGAPICGPGWIGGATPPSASTIVRAVTTWDPDGIDLPMPKTLVVAYSNGATSAVARWSGASWETLASGIDGAVNALAVWDTKLIAAGDFTSIGGQTVSLIAQLDGEQGAVWSRLHLTAAADLSVTPPTLQGYAAVVRALYVDPNSGNLVVGGGFSHAGTSTGNVLVNRLAEWNGFEWSGIGGGTNGPVLSLGSDANGSLVVGGAFTSVGSGTPAIGRGIAIWDGGSWLALGSGIANGSVRCLALMNTSTGPRIVAGGNFNGVYNSGSSLVSNTLGIAMWNGSSWSAMGTGLNSSVDALFTLGTDKLLAGGAFSASGTVSMNGVARWTTSVGWQSLGGGVAGVDLNVNAITKLPSGEFVFGGRFSIAGPHSAQNLGRWSDTGVPWIAEQPVPGQVLNVGQTVDKSVLPAVGYDFAGPLTYQWSRGTSPVANGDEGASLGGGDVSGANTSMLTIRDVQTSDTGNYKVKVSNSCGFVNSAQSSLGAVCPADHNGDGIVSIDDLFLYFNDYFTGCDDSLPLGCFASADFNGVDGVTVDDLFLYINAYFTGCL